MLSDEVKSYVERSVLCWLATVDAEGWPNVSPKEIFTAYDDERLIIANVASPGSVRNLLRVERACVSFIDVFVQKGFKVRGRAQLVWVSDPRYRELLTPLEDMAGGKFSINGIIEVWADEVEAILAPSYRFYPETTEGEQVEGAMVAYGVTPARR
ncbi:pyridoxamine 5'-phosphate oxidase family protein [Arhodomonas aquaeolei]|uniref:pyridoxamine 5'-phosphate oxidase family protein n=1 Tax=Arhodomonas aquaeolei TaxID=2369 RepID=UPI00058B345A|nr:pyridoxamine 5'-phosphate oxidase family protein [Arhodomonas aquaeolei]